MTTSQLGGQGDRHSVISLDDEMARYGITRRSVDYFHYKEFRYTNVQDALAQAKREGAETSAREIDDTVTD